MQGFPGKVRQVAWSKLSKSQKDLVLAGACMEGITIWQYQQKLQKWQSHVLNLHEGFVQGIAFHPQHHLLASTGNDGKVCLWYRAQKLIQMLSVSPAGCSCLAWHPHTDYLVVGGQAGTIWGFWGA